MTKAKLNSTCSDEKLCDDSIQNIACRQRDGSTTKTCVSTEALSIDKFCKIYTNGVQNI